MAEKQTPSLPSPNPTRVPEFDFRSWLVKNIFQAISFVILLLNVWLASKLAPLAEGIGKLDLRVSATEERITVHDNRLEALFKQVVDNYADILKELGGLNRKCDE